METVVSLAQQALLFLGPLLLAAMGAVCSGASGLPAYGLEGMMVAGGFAAAAMGVATGSFVIGLLGGLGAGLLVAVLYLLCVRKLKAKPLLTGIGMHGVVLGLALLLAQATFGTGGESPEVRTTALLPRFTFSGMAEAGHVDVGTFLALALIPLMALLLYQSRFGLRLRTIGLSEKAVSLRGIPVARYQEIAVLLCGGLGGLGGAVLVLGEAGGEFGLTTFQGVGYLALLTAAMGRDTLPRTLGYALCFGLLSAFSQWAAQQLSLPEAGQPLILAALVLLLLVLVGRRVTKRAQREPTLSQDA